MARFHEYWAGLSSRLGRLPTRRELDPLSFAYALSSFLLLEFHRDTHRVRCRLAGEDVMRALGWPPARGRFLDGFLDPEHAGETAELCRRCLDDGTPLMHRRVVEFQDRGPLEVVRVSFPLSAMPGEPETLAVVFQSLRPLLQGLPDDDG